MLRFRVGLAAERICGTARRGGCGDRDAVRDRGRRRRSVAQCWQTASVRARYCAWKGVPPVFAFGGQGGGGMEITGQQRAGQVR